MKANVSKIAGALLVLALLAALPVAAASDDGTGAREKKDQPDVGTPEGRHFSLDRDLHSVRMNAFLSEGGSTSSTSFYMGAMDGLSTGYRSSYSTCGWSGDLSAWIDILGVVEYLDSNGNGVYDPLKDKVVSTLPLSERFGYLEFIPGKDPTPVPPLPPTDGEYRKGHSIGYEIGKNWGAHDRENGLEYDPDPKGHLAEYFNGTDTANKEALRGQDFIDGLIDGYMAGYDEGYGIAHVDPIVEPDTRGQDPSEKGCPVPDERPDQTGSEKNRPWPPICRPYFKPLEVITEKYDQDSYALSYSVEDRTGVFHAKIGIAGELFGHGIVVPERARIVISIVDYPYESKSGRLAVISYAGYTFSSYSNPWTSSTNATGFDDAQKMPLIVFYEDGAEVSVVTTSFEKHVSYWEDLHSKGRSGYFGLIFSLQDPTVPPGNDDNDTADKKVPVTVNESGDVADKGALLPIAITLGIAAATLAVMMVLSMVGITIYRKGRSVW